MGKNLTPRYLIIILILGWAISTLLPTLRYQRLSESQKEELRNSGELEDLESQMIRQGLDLKGGMYIVLEADIPTLVSNLAEIKDERLERIIVSAQEESLNPNTDFFTVFENEVKNDGIKLSRYYHEYGASLDDIITALKNESDDAINRVLEILQNRVDQFGVSEPTIQKQGQHRIVVELAGIQDSDRARSLLQSTALLEFYLVKNNSVTSEIISQLDDLLKDDSETNEQSSKENLDLDLKTKDQTEDKAQQVSELFGENESSTNETTSKEEVEDIFKDTPFSSLLTALPGDIGIEEKNLYAFKKLLENQDVQNKLKNSNGQLLFSQEAKSFSTDSPQKFYRLII